MRTKQVIWGALFLVVAVLVAGCGGSGEDSAQSTTVAAGGEEASAQGEGGSSEADGTLRIFAYSDAFDPVVFDRFVEDNPDLTIEKSEIAGDTEAVAKLKAGFEADVINTCAGPIDQEIENGSLQPIDTTRITDWDLIYPFFKNIKGVNVDGKTYMLPLVGGVYGVVYRPSAFDTPPQSWMDLFTTDKRVTAPDDPLTSIITAGLALGYFPPQTMTDAQLESVKDLLLEQKTDVVTYYQGSTLIPLWKNNEVDITAADIAVVNELDGQDAAFAPVNPPLAWTCGYSIGAHAENLDAVYAFLNYALSPLVQEVQATNFGYLVSSKRSAEALPASVLEANGQNDLDQYDTAATFGTPSDMSTWTALWQGVKSG